MKTEDQKAADWLVLGFVKNWSFKMFKITLRSALGKECRDFAFLPNDLHWDGAVGVRAYVAQNFPRLNGYLFDHIGEPDKLIKLSEQIVKLKWNGDRPLGSLTTAERRELTKSRNELRGATTAYGHSRSTFKAHSLTNWNTCK